MNIKKKKKKKIHGNLLHHKYYIIYKNLFESLIINLKYSNHSYKVLYLHHYHYIIQDYYQHQHQNNHKQTIKYKAQEEKSFQYKKIKYYNDIGNNNHNYYQIKKHDYQIDIDSLINDIDDFPAADHLINKMEQENYISSSSQVSTTLHVSLPNIMKIWSPAQRSTSQDWMNWMQTFSNELLKESPSYSLRACSILAQKYPPLSRSLFNAAFLSCWKALFDQHQDKLINSLETTFRSPSMPAEIIQDLLNLAEFMEHHDTALPIDDDALGNLSFQCQAYAKALYYKEKQLLKNNKNQQSLHDIYELLININNKLSQKQAARGILAMTRKNKEQSYYLKANNPNLIKLKNVYLWYEKLERWEDALIAYNDEINQIIIQETNNNTIKHHHHHHHSIYNLEKWKLICGQMRCYKELGNWNKVYNLGQQLWSEINQLEQDQDLVNHSKNNIQHTLIVNNNTTLEEDMKRNLKIEIASLLCLSNCQLQKWDELEQYVYGLETTSVDYNFYQSILLTHQANYHDAEIYITKTFRILGSQLTLVTESYNSSYYSIMRAQQLVELREIINYKQQVANNKDDVEQKLKIFDIWSNRLRDNKQNVYVWQSILMIRSLLDDYKSNDNKDIWLDYIALLKK